MPRFVILEHDWPDRHWDFLLEDGPTLAAWRLFAEPAIGRSVAAEPNAPHRPAYLDYEGPVSGGRGGVTRWDAGTFERTESGVELRGTRISGTASWDGSSWTFSGVS